MKQHMSYWLFKETEETDIYSLDREDQETLLGPCEE